MSKSPLIDPSCPYLRSSKKVEGFRASLMKLHDELADLKSYFDGQKHAAGACDDKNPD